MMREASTINAISVNKLIALGTEVPSRLPKGERGHARNN